MKIRKAVIPAAGLGTRFLPVTKAIPKEMLPIVDKPTIQYIVEEAIRSGIHEIAIVVPNNKPTIRKHFERSCALEKYLAEKNNISLLKELIEISAGANIQYVTQDQPKGLGHAVWCARKFVGHEPFAVLLGDMIVDDNSLEQMIELYKQRHCSVIGVQEVPKTEVYKYGIIEGMVNSDGSIAITGLVEKPPIEAAPSNIAIQGRYIFTPFIFQLLSRQTAGIGNEIQLTDAIAELMKVEPVYGKTVSGRVFDIGSKIGFLIANLEIALQRADTAEKLAEYLDSLENRRRSDGTWEIRKVERA